MTKGSNKLILRTFSVVYAFICTYSALKGIATVDGYMLSRDLRNEIVNAKRGRGTGREARDQSENVLGIILVQKQTLSIGCLVALK